MLTNPLHRTLFLSAVSLSTAIALEQSAQAVVIASPTAIGSATPFNASLTAPNAFNGNSNEYASQGLGVNTFIEMNFGSTVTFDRVILVNRNSTAPGDRVSQSTFTFSNDSIFDSGDPTATITHNSGQAQGSISGFDGPVTTQFARWDVDAQADGTPVANNTGIMEMIFLNTPADSEIVSGVTAYNSATPFNATYVAANSVNGIVGTGAGGAGIEYASAGQGVNTFIDFDMGGVKPLIGFDLIDRLFAVDHVAGFDLLFSNDPAFSSVITTLSYNKGASLTASDVFSSPIFARYVRWDVTSLASTSPNSGISEIIFYSAIIPEPASLSLLGLAAGALMIRRRTA